MTMPFDERTLQRRVAGSHDIRMDGMTDLVMRARGMAVMDLGCNRGAVGYEFAKNGARLVHGCDIAEDAVYVAQAWFRDLRSVESLHAVADLTRGPAALAPFRGQDYDITLCLALIHKLKRVMPDEALASLLHHLGHRTKQYFAWRATSEKFDENEIEMAMLDKRLGQVGLKRIHTSYISRTLGVAAIWAKGY